jgi:CBS domain-containing protein
MATVKQILDAKGNAVWCIESMDSVFDAISRMSEKEIGALIVTREGKPVGIITERDYARKVILQGRSSLDTAVHEVMTERVVFVDPAATIQDCMALMAAKKIRHLPVLEGDRLAGILSMRDLLAAVIDDQQYTIEQLERYISG